MLAQKLSSDSTSASVTELSLFNLLSKEDLAKYDVLLLGIKPTQLKDVVDGAKNLKHFAGEVVSTLAGVTINTLKTTFPNAKIHSRLMPSIVMAEYPSTALALSTNNQLSILSSWYKQPVGDLLQVKNDEELDNLTLIFGSNAAYMSALIQPWIDNLVKTIPSALALKLTLEQWSSALQFLKGKDLTDVINKVKTPGGITAQALFTLDEEKYSPIITKAINASSYRANEVGEIVSRDLSSSNPHQ